MTNIAKVVEKVIAEYSEEKKAEVTDWILKLGVRPDDPLFNLYAELGTTQFALQQLPGRLDSLVVGWTDMVDDKLNSASKVAIQQQKSAIAQAANDLIKMTKQAGGALPLLGVSNWRLAQVAGVLGFVLALGATIGVFTYKTIAESVTFQQAVSGTAILQPEDKKLLDWAKSNEGKVARSIYVRNAAIIKTCRQQKKYSGGCIIAVD
ncbi:DUF6753 family protein [Nostoc sp. FACHB-280]|uniref:DUF6753 family protein n=1 Tax=Nostoc sp. FACHB-280 TaxID=2692839 RepID=UPI00168A4855|nr:DUF6753 family protein [Nostoc sp. FACHB-280]MBD2496534.1 hypothetical protein [Nostoc sp. FACHB-280]